MKFVFANCLFSCYIFLVYGHQRITDVETRQSKLSFESKLLGGLVNVLDLLVEEKHLRRELEQQFDEKVEQLQQKFDELEESRNRLEKRLEENIAELNDHNESRRRLEEKVEQNVVELNKHKESRRRLEEKLEQHVVELNEHKESRRRLEEKVEQNVVELNELKESRRQLEQRLNANSTALSGLKQNNIEEIVAFSARASGQKSGNVVLYPRIITNIGGAYNASDSKFYCPTKGLYLFQTTLISLTVGAYVRILRNGAEIQTIYASHDSGYDSGSGLVLLYLNVTDRVWIKPNTVSMNIDHNSYFTGVLLNQG